MGNSLRRTNERSAVSTTMLKSFRSLRKFFRRSILTGTLFDLKTLAPRRSRRTRRSDINEEAANLKKNGFLLRALRALRGDIHFSFGCGSASLGLLAVVASVIIFPAGWATAQSDPSEKLPMYGQPGVARPENLKKIDEDLIRDATFRFGNRQAASRALVEQGWASVRKGMLDTAMRRFNEAWLLNPKNYQAFWGFGAVLSEQEKLAEAIEQLETARDLIDDPKQRVALLSDLGAVHSSYGARLPADKQLDRAQHFVIANNRFAESLEMDPNYSRSWREWAFSLYEQERYSEAWVKARRAMELNSEPFPAGFLDTLRKKVPEAK